MTECGSVVKQKELKMYHISNDKRAKRSAEKIGNGLLLCLADQNLTEVTVTDVQKVSHVGRATFYRLFDNTVDVISYLCDTVFETVGHKYQNMNRFDSKEASLMFIREWMNHKTLLKAIVDCNRLDLLYNAHTKYLGGRIDFFFPNGSVTKEQRNYLLMTMTACTSACLAIWIQNGAHENAEEVQNRLCGSLQMICNILN